MKLKIGQVGDKQKIEIDVGAAEVEASKVYCGIGIDTDWGYFGIAERDGVIEIMFHGTLICDADECKKMIESCNLGPRQTSKIEHRQIATVPPSPQLENCPFCGESQFEGVELTETDDKETWYVHCDNCLTQGPSASGELMAADLWNTRDGEEVRNQFKRLNDESILPMAIDNGDEMFVSGLGNGIVRHGGAKFFKELTVTHRDSRGKEESANYVLSVFHSPDEDDLKSEDE